MLALTFFDWRLTDWPILIEGAVTTAALLTALTVIYKKGFKPLREVYVLFKKLIIRANAALDSVEFHLKPNHGTSLFDKVNESRDSIDNIETELAEIKGHVVMLLELNDLRDIAGIIYSSEQNPKRRIDDKKEKLDEDD